MLKSHVAKNCVDILSQAWLTIGRWREGSSSQFITVLLKDWEILSHFDNLLFTSVKGLTQPWVTSWRVGGLSQTKLGGPASTKWPPLASTDTQPLPVRSSAFCFYFDFTSFDFLFFSLVKFFSFSAISIWKFPILGNLKLFVFSSFVYILLSICLSLFSWGLFLVQIFHFENPRLTLMSNINKFNYVLFSSVSSEKQEDWHIQGWVNISLICELVNKKAAQLADPKWG